MFLVADRRDSAPPHTRRLRCLDLDRCVFPSVQANGLYGVGHSQYWLCNRAPEGAEMIAAPDATTVDKPPYRVPLMSEIRAIPWNGLTWVSTFSGTGGTSTGARMAGYRVLAAVEFVPAAVASYKANCAPYTKVFQRDVREITGQEILKAIGLKRGQLDVLDGSAPCEPFSTAGARDKRWGQVVEYSGQQQRTDDLLHQFVRLVDEIRPRVFVAENVKGLVTGRAKGYYKRVMADLRALGYVVESRILDAQWLGVPQHRERVIIVGVRANMRPRRKPAFPAPLPYNYTVRDALAHVVKISTDPNFDRRRRDGLTEDEMMVSSDRPSPTITSMHSYSAPVGKVDVVGVGTARHIPGGLDDRLAGAEIQTADRPAPTVTARPSHAGNAIVEEVVAYRFDTQGARQGAQRDRLDEPAPTITNGGLGKGGGTPACHHQLTVADDWEIVEQIVGNDKFEPVFGALDVPSPTIMASGARTSGEVRETDGAAVRRRYLTIPELKRISGFPDDFELPGTFGQQWERLGDCVPPPMAAAYAAVIRDSILDTRRTTQ